ncbi:hypothetical protein [Paenibacillus sp. FSL K6-2524]|uniref:hypothetical protein n=1 Tax=Paenibacillus sp. FSL K6-2524 TaxID=2954516 RepID=UPI0030F64196
MNQSSSQKPLLELRLYDNAIDFLNRSISSYLVAIEEDTYFEYKYAILFLATGSELILKSLLEDVHPLFIRENLDKEEKTVSAENLVTRINKVFSYETTLKTISNHDRENFEAIRTIRNNIIHKEVIFDENTNPKKIFAETLYSLDRVVKEFKGKTLSSVLENWSLVVNVDEIKTTYYRNAKGIKIGTIALPCAFCSIEKLVKDGEGLRCLHCGQKYKTIFEAVHTIDDEDLKENLFLAFVEEKEKEKCNFCDCPECDTADYAWYDPKLNALMCFKCGNLQSTKCSRCSCNSVIEAYYDYDSGITEHAEYCVNCDDYINTDICSGCNKDYYKLEKNITIDVRNNKIFRRYFPKLVSKGESPFIITNLCPECYRITLQLEEKEIINLV